MFDSAAALYVPTHKRELGMVFQSYAIWPHMNVFEERRFPLKVRGTGRAQIRSAVEGTLATMNMEHLAERPATLLSGGQQQRLALARAIVGRPRLLLLDEPLSNLDAKLRERMRFELKRLQSELGLTTIYVTHDQTEALALSEEIAVMYGGRIVQQGTPNDIYYKPNDEYVADFIGSTNLIPATLVERADDGTCTVSIAGVNTRGLLVDLAAGADVTIAMRPEGIRIAAAGGGSDGLPGYVKSSVFLGESTDFLVEAAGTDIRVRVSGARPDISDGDDVRLSLAQDGRVFARTTELPVSKVLEIAEQEPLASATT